MLDLFSRKSIGLLRAAEVPEHSQDRGPSRPLVGRKEALVCFGKLVSFMAERIVLGTVLITFLRQFRWNKNMRNDVVQIIRIDRQAVERHGGVTEKVIVYVIYRGKENSEVKHT